MGDAQYTALIGFHLLVALIWLGAIARLFIICRRCLHGRAAHAGEHSANKRQLARARTAVRAAPALMLLSAMLLLHFGRWWPGMADWLLPAALVIAPAWLTLLWFDAGHAASAGAAVARAAGEALAWLLAGFWLGLGGLSLRNSGPLEAFLAWKALLFGGMVVGLIALDVAVRRSSPLPVRWSAIISAIVVLLLLAASWLGAAAGSALR